MPRPSLTLLLSLCLLSLGGSAALPAADVAASPLLAAEPLPPLPGPPPPQPALAPEATPTPEAAPSVPAPIVSIHIQGNKEIPTQDLQAVVSSKVGGPYSEEQVNRDREAIRNLGWFQTVAVERERVESGIRLVFRVIENPVIRDIQFEGISVITRDQLLAVMQTKPGSIYNILRLTEDARAIEELYRKQGYILAVVLEARRLSPEGVLTIVIAEGVIEDIKIVGNTYTKTYVIRRYLRTRPGDVYNYTKVSQDVARLTNTQYFQTVRQDAEVGEKQPGQLILIITVVERQRTGQVTLGGAYTSVQGLIGFLDLTKANLRGTGQMITVRGEWGGRKSYELGYRNPWIMTPETSLSLGIYDRLVLREAFVTAAEGTHRSVFYDERRAGGNLALGRPLSDRTTLYLRLRSDDVSISNLNEADREFLTGPAFAPRQVRSLTLAAIADSRDDIFNPRGGAYSHLAFEFAGIFGGSDFNKYTVDHRRYLKAGRRSTLAMRLLAGTTTGDAPYLEQFLIGGPDSLRGFRVDRFAGSRMAILNTEYRFPLSSSLIGVGFVDVGDAWGGPIAEDPFFRSDKSFTTHLGYGVGVRVQTPIGPLRLDLGFSEEGTETHFGVSHMF